MRVIAKKVLRQFWTKNPDCEQQLKSWFREAEKADWQSPNQIKKDYPSASILENNRVVFNIKGTHYRTLPELIITMEWFGFDSLVPNPSMTK